MQKVISAVVALFVLLGSAAGICSGVSVERSLAKGGVGLPPWQAASAAGVPSDRRMFLIDQALLKLPAGYFFVPQAERRSRPAGARHVVNDTSHRRPCRRHGSRMTGGSATGHPLHQGRLH